jgi:hypothetical protein
MKKLILAASLLAPLAVAAPALAQVDASPNVAVTNAQAPREFTARRSTEQSRPAGVSRAEQNLIDRQGAAGTGF